MATSSSPSFGVTPLLAVGSTPATLDTSRTAPTNVTTIYTSVTGAKIEKLRFKPNATITSTPSGIVTVFLYDGTTYHLFDEVLFSADTASTTDATVAVDNAYYNLVLPAPSPTWSIRVGCTTATLQAAIKVFAFGVIL